MMQFVHAALDVSTRPRVSRIARYLLISLGSLLIGLLPTALAWGDSYSPQMIVPGIGIGPARLGMTEAQARRVLEAAHLGRAECTVDVFIGHGRVIALGTRFGGCLELPLPPSVGRVVISGRIVLPEVAGIGGSPAAYARAFGEPARFHIDSQSAILLWANGLVARATMTETGELITYLAVVPANSVVPLYSILAL